MKRKPSNWFMFYQNQNVIAELKVSRYSEHHVWFEGCEWPHEIKCYGHQQFYKSLEDAKSGKIKELEEAIKNSEWSIANCRKQIEQVRAITGPEQTHSPYGFPPSAWVRRGKK